jgi:amino acid transporter
VSTPQETKPQTPQARLLAFILAGVFYALGVFFFIGDTIDDWGTELQAQHSSPDDLLSSVADFVRGLGITTGDKSQWVIPCILIGVGLTVTGSLTRGKK